MYNNVHLTDYCASSIQLFPVDFWRYYWENCGDHQSDQLFCALQGLVPCREKAPFYSRGLLLEILSQQHSSQLLLRSAPRADTHHMGPGMLH